MHVDESSTDQHSTALDLERLAHDQYRALHSSLNIQNLGCISPLSITTGVA